MHKILTEKNHLCRRIQTNTFASRATVFIPKNLKKRAFCKLYLTSLFRVGLNNRTFFHNKCYCEVDRKAVILHSIKFGSF